MSNANKKKRKTRTTYYQHRSQTSKKLFHSPQAYGELIDIPMTASMHALSLLSILVQLGLTAFAAYAAYTTDTIPALESSGFSDSMLYLALPAVSWLLAVGFRFTCRAVPLDMWRLPASVKRGVIKQNGTPLKLLTLLVELETALCLCYIAAALYLGRTPSTPALFLWIAALVLSIYFPCRSAARAA